jgi:hypothetical protein
MYVLCVSLFPYPKRQNFSAFTPTLCVVGNAKAKSSRAGLLAIFAATTSLIFAPILSTLRLRLRVRPWLTRVYQAMTKKEDLERQKQVLESYCAAKGWTFELVADLGSGMNYRKRGLQKLLNQIIAGDVGRIVLNHKDRLLRFGAELVFAICEI